jgi:FtsH-binding integral membrane protein
VRAGQIEKNLTVTNFLNTVPTWLIMLVVVLLILVLNEVGYRIGRPKADESGDAPSASVQAAAYTLLALLLGFSFSLALNRYDARRTVFREEVGAIRRAYLRAGLLDDAAARLVRADLRRYVAVRLDFAAADADPPRRAADAQKSLQLQDAMWTVAQKSAKRDPRSTMLPLFVTSLGDTIDSSTAEAAILTEHIPDLVMLVLIFIALIVATMMGYNFARKGQRAELAKILYAAVFTLALGIVFDLDRPQRGVIRVNLEPMRVLQTEIDQGRVAQSAFTSQEY